MQKLLRRTPPPGPTTTLLLCSSSSSYLPLPKPTFLSLSPHPKNTNNPSLAFTLKPSKTHQLMPTSTYSTFHLRPSVPFLPTSSSSSATSSLFPRRRLAAVGTTLGCSCRPWLVLKAEVRRSGVAWVHTEAAGSDGGGAVESEESEGEEESGGEEEEEGKVVSGSTAGSEEKRVRVQRRRSGGGGGGSVGSPDLLTIPGVGPRNFRKLVQKGIGAVAELKQLYRDKFFGKSKENMVEYLQSSVGIVHRNHAESITVFIKKSVDEELKEDGSNSVVTAQKNRITLCVEGNISVGKTTFLRRIANETIELQDLVEIVPEPVDKWQDVGAEHFNILDAFYAQPERYAYTFQNYVFVTRAMQERDSSGGVQPLRLMERSVFSDRMVFVRAVHESKWMSEMEISIYESWFDPVVSCLPGLIPDGFIYLRASPDTCHKRMMLRKRTEEGGVSLDYLRGLHEKHESWLYPCQSQKQEVLSVSKPPFLIDSSLHPDIRDRVIYLEGPQMHSSIQKVPALVLDCEPDIDFNKDIEAKSHYARQVAKFFEFVKKKKADETPKGGEGSGKDSHPPIMLPQNGGLWVPGGKHLPESALKSLDLRRAMSLSSG